MHKIDFIDLKILRIIQEKGRISNFELSEKVGISSSACHRRMNILENEKVIIGYKAILNEKVINFKMTVYVKIKLTKQIDEALKSFERSVKLIPEVLECHLMSGEADYLLKVVSKDIDDFERVHKQHISKLPFVSNVISSFALRNIFGIKGYPI